MDSLCERCAGGDHSHDWLVLEGGFRDGSCRYVTVVESADGDVAVSCDCGVR